MAGPVSHDQNFKNLIVDYPRKALAFFAPSEAPHSDDAARVVPVREEQLQERLGGNYRRLDVPLLAEWDDGRREAISFVVEEESDRHRFSPHRLAHYCLDLFHARGSPSRSPAEGSAVMFDTARVVPVVVFLRPGAAPGPLALGTERRAYLTFDYLTCALGDTPAEDWVDSDNVVARVNLPNMRRPSRFSKVDVYARAVRGLFDLEPDPDRRAKYIDFIDIYAELTDNEHRHYRQRHPEESSIMVGLNQRARDEGRQEGVRLGRAEGGRAVLERLLRRRFGTLPPTVDARLGGASEAELEAWADNVLDAGTLDDVSRRRAASTQNAPSDTGATV